jgi:uncharacterized OsmC-like protein
MLEYTVRARRLDGHGSEISAKEARLVVDTDPAGRADALNPAELLLGSLAACILKGAERVLPALGFGLRGMEVTLRATRQDSPPRIIAIDYEIAVDTDEPDRRIDLLHANIRKYGTVSNTLALALPVNGTIRRR